ncbi:hypothetical protein [Polyangium aurulentum]|uniref:hypothetical protein n=1 Tax=Polyangium aurulentum TaxID=2567896 RepID=UPI0010AE19F9|nr:hypothetical protein [Polyangium aurulentum]UQA58960.1 hypothetical protein E8A73_000095 [Polyangium aurulentum]
MRTSMLTLLAALAALASLAGCSRPRGAATDAPDCTVARVGHDVVTVADAEVVRAAVQPPLTRGEARRLAVSATAAYRLQHPEGPMAGIGARLHAHRQAVRERSELDIVPVAPGACWTADGVPAPVSN